MFRKRQSYTGGHKKLVQPQAHFCMVHTLYHVQVHLPGEFWAHGHPMPP